jgi:hypothetical protein
MAARARGLLHEAAGERAAALACLRDATVRAVRVADPYVWIHAYCLEALAAVAIADGAPDAGALASARLLAEAIDNPALHAELAAAV